MIIGSFGDFFRTGFGINEFPSDHVARIKPGAHRFGFVRRGVEKDEFRIVVGLGLVIGHRQHRAENLAFILIANLDNRAAFRVLFFANNIRSGLENDSG